MCIKVEQHISKVQNMESAESKWLKSIFQETQYDGDSPHPKRMKFSEVSGELQQHFPHKEFTPYETSRYIQEAFPNRVQTMWKSKANTSARVGTKVYS